VITVSTKDDLDASLARWRDSWAIEDQSSPFAAKKLADAHAMLDELTVQRQKLVAAKAAADQIAAVDRELAMTQDALAQTSKEAILAPKATTPAKPMRVAVYDVHEIVGMADDAPVMNADQRNALQDLVNTVKETLGSTDCTISEFNGMVVVNAADAVQRRVEVLLDQLREIHLRRIADAKERAAAQHPK
jgi:hypothetical protein